MQLTEPQAGSDVGALRTKAERAPATAATASPAEDLHHLRRARPDRQHHPFRAGAAARCAARHARAFRCSWCRSSGQRRRLARRAQRRARAFDRAQARHPRLADLHHGLWRQGRRDRLSGRRGEPRPRLHVHDDEPRAARGRPAGRRRSPSARPSRRSPMRASASRAAARRGDRAPIIEHPDVQAHAADHARADRAPRARSATPPRVAIDRAQRGKSEAARKAARRSAPRCSRRSPRPSRPTSASRSPRSACRCTAAWATSRRPAPRSIYRDARIAAIYEGTNGIQAIDLVTRKLPLDGGTTVARLYRRVARHRRGGEGEQRAGLRRDRRAARRGGRQPRARDAMAAGASRTIRTRRSPARRPICGCSATPPAAACWPSRRSPRCAMRRRRGARRARALLCREHRGAGRRPRTHRDRRRRQRHAARNAALGRRNERSRHRHRRRAGPHRADEPAGQEERADLGDVRRHGRGASRARRKIRRCAAC